MFLDPHNSACNHSKETTNIAQNRNFRHSMDDEDEKEANRSLGLDTLYLLRVKITPFLHSAHYKRVTEGKNTCMFLDPHNSACNHSKQPQLLHKTETLDVQWMIKMKRRQMAHWVCTPKLTNTNHHKNTKRLNRRKGTRE